MPKVTGVPKDDIRAAYSITLMAVINHGCV